MLFRCKFDAPFDHFLWQGNWHGKYKLVQFYRMLLKVYLLLFSLRFIVVLPINFNRGTVKIQIGTYIHIGLYHPNNSIITYIFNALLGNPFLSLCTNQSWNEHLNTELRIL